jgi:hypothetical protein
MLASIYELDRTGTEPNSPFVQTCAILKPISQMHAALTWTSAVLSWFWMRETVWPAAGGLREADVCREARASSALLKVRNDLFVQRRVENIRHFDLSFEEAQRQARQSPPPKSPTISYALNEKIWTRNELK